jgi:hypothetical protein
MVIITKHLGPTATKGARITAKDGEHVITKGRDYSMNPDAAHAAAARELALKFGGGIVASYPHPLNTDEYIHIGVVI